MGDTAAQRVPAGAPAGGTAWMTARWSTLCGVCAVMVEPGQWQALMDVPGRGPSWIHEPCALGLGAAPRPDDVEVERGPRATGPVRIVVIGSGAWPHDRAVEVRDGIEALARGHREVVIVHGTRRDRRGRLRGVDAWAALTATRLGYSAEPHDTAAVTVDELLALRPSVVVAFPLQQHPDPPTDASNTTSDAARDRGGLAGPDSGGDDVEALAAAAELAGVPVLVHRPGAGTASPAG